jgi:urease accessory protein
MTKKLSTKLTRAIALGLLIAPGVAQAHPGHIHGLSEGVSHPFSGIDHLAAMIGIGLWAAQLGGRARFLVPLAFTAATLLGGILGFAGQTPPGVEQGIAASVLVVGLLLTVTGRMPTQWAMVLAAAFAIFHGIAHASEIPGNITAATYAVGFLASTVILQLSGMAIGAVAARLDQPGWLRMAGVAILLGGVLNLASGF